MNYAHFTQPHHNLHLGRWARSIAKFGDRDNIAKVICLDRRNN